MDGNGLYFCHCRVIFPLYVDDGYFGSFLPLSNEEREVAAVRQHGLARFNMGSDNYTVKKWMNAKLPWVASEEGGRKSCIGVNVKYCPIIVFSTSSREDGDWSAEIYVQSHSSKCESVAKIS
jgi:hypothetical protein